MAKVKPEPPILYWDSCTFISWLDGGMGRTVEEMSGLNAVAADINRETCRLVTSTLTHVEVLESEDGDLAKFDTFLERQNNTVAVVDTPIARKAAKIRSTYRKENIRLSAEDAVHLATAIIYKASIFHTFDSGLLRFDGNVQGHPLRIEKPAVDRLAIDFQ